VVAPWLWPRGRVDLGWPAISGHLGATSNGIVASNPSSVSSGLISAQACRRPSSDQGAEPIDSDLDKDFDLKLEEATAHLRQTIEVPTDGTEDDAVAAVIDDYRDRTGVELDEFAIRAVVHRLREEAAVNGQA
jgi:hypothetical protein